MRGYVVYTSSIKRSIMAKLNHYAKAYNMPKSKIIELALTRYLGTVKKAELAQTFEAARRDKKLRSYSKHAAGDLSTVFHRKK